MPLIYLTRCAHTDCNNNNMTATGMGDPLGGDDSVCGLAGGIGSMDASISSVTQSCPTLCDPMDCSMPGFPVLDFLGSSAGKESTDAYLSTTSQIVYIKYVHVNYTSVE